MSLLVVNDEILAVAKNYSIDCYNYSSHAFLQLQPGSSQEQESIVDIVISPDNKLLGILLCKKLYIYELPELKQVESFTLPRSASKIRFDCSSKKLLVADKTGDVFIFEILKEDKGTKILGHLSLLLNILQTDDGKYLITSDRDEKIKVSCYPNAYNIQTFCLGHKEFVMHIEILPHATNVLTSASGDGTVKIWNYTSGKLLHTIDTYNDINENEQLKQKFSKLMEGEVINSLPIVHYAITKLNEDSSLIALTVHSYMKVLIYKLTSTNNQFSHSFVLDMSMEDFPTSLKFHNLSLFIYNSVKLKVLQYDTSIDVDNINLNLSKELQVFENHEVTSSESKNNDHDSIKQLFKRKFDNVQEYQERKKVRIEKATG